MLTFLLHGWRSWKSAKPIAFFAIFALALGIGSATAIFTVVQTVLVNPFSYRNADQIYLVRGTWRAQPGWQASLSYQDGLDFTERQRTASAFGCLSSGSYNIFYKNSAMHVAGTQISPSIGAALGISPRIGRWFLDEKQEPNGVHAAVIADSLWKQLGGSPSIVGQALTINGKPYTITGVMPAWFRLPVDDPSQALWLPLDPDPEQRKNRGYNYLHCLAFKNPAVSAQQLTADMKNIGSSLYREHSDETNFDTALVEKLADVVVEDIRPTLLLLLGAVAALLLITCANVGGLLVARSVTRARETALRVAIGAARWQLALQYFAEGLIVSLCGATLGAVLSYSLVRVVVSTASDVLPRADEVSIDSRAIIFALGLAVVCGVLFSLAPLWQAMSIAPNEVLSDGVRASASARSRHLLRILVVAEIALAFGLLAVGVILLSQLNRLYHVDPGFERHNLYTARVFVPISRFPTDEARVDVNTRLLNAIRSAPGVESAAFTSLMPFRWGNNSYIEVEGGAPMVRGKSDVVEERFISPDFFKTMHIPMLEGRDFNSTDVLQKPPGVMNLIINHAAAKVFWPNRDPLGTYLKLEAWSGPRWRVVGVVADMHNAGLAREPRPELYINYRQNAMQALDWAIRSHLDEGMLNRELDAAVKRADPQMPIYNLQSMQEVFDKSLAKQRLGTYMVSFFSLSALLLALLGVYGVVSYSVRQRTTEIGTRMAIGATTPNLLRLVVGDGLKMAAAGIAIGLVAVLTLAHFLSTSSLNVGINDPRAFTMATLFVILLTSLACFFPAWRATLVSPLIAIRNEPGSMWQNTRFGFWRVAEQISGLISRVKDDYSETGESESLAEITEAARHANTFPEALRAALDCLRGQIRAESLALLVQKQAGQPYRCAAVVPDACTDEWVLTADALIAGRLHHYAGALPISSGDLDAANRWAGTDLAETQMLREMGATLVVRASVKKEISGLLFAGRPIGRSSYTSFEKRLLRAVASQLSLMIENSRLTDRIVEQERLRREIMMATEVQKRLFPENPPHTASMELAGVCVPARGVGGDYYDFIDLGHQRLGIALADVAGKGIAAALIMSVVQASLRSLAGANGASLATLASTMNRLLHRSTGSSSYATFFYAEVDAAGRKLRYVNAGHNPPYVLRSGGNGAVIEELPAGGTIIGMFAQSSYEEATIDLAAGDILLVFTDGVPEALDPRDEEFGEERLQVMLRKYAHLPVNDMASQFLQELKAWISDAAQYDDLTFILMKVL